MGLRVSEDEDDDVPCKLDAPVQKAQKDRRQKARPQAQARIEAPHWGSSFGALEVSGLGLQPHQKHNTEIRILLLKSTSDLPLPSFSSLDLLHQDPSNPTHGVLIYTTLI